MARRVQSRPNNVWATEYRKEKATSWRLSGALQRVRWRESGFPRGRRSQGLSQVDARPRQNFLDAYNHIKLDAIASQHVGDSANDLPTNCNPSAVVLRTSPASMSRLAFSRLFAVRPTTSRFIDGYRTVLVSPRRQHICRCKDISDTPSVVSIIH